MATVETKRYYQQRDAPWTPGFNASSEPAQESVYDLPATAIPPRGAVVMPDTVALYDWRDIQAAPAAESAPSAPTTSEEVH